MSEKEIDDISEEKLIPKTTTLLNEEVRMVLVAYSGSLLKQLNILSGEDITNIIERMLVLSRGIND